MSGRAVGVWEMSLPAADGTTTTLAGPVELLWHGVFFGKVHGGFGHRAVDRILEARNDPERDPIVEDNVSCLTTPVRYDIHTAQLTVS